MKAAVNHLRTYMEKASDANRGKVVLATVKGDVHDIGKNLVDIIFTNNGYQVINLGIKVAPETLIAACQEHRPDVVGLSGLLVKSAHQMVTTAQDLSAAGVMPPLLVGGAALTERFTDLKIARAYGGFVSYARDAMSGLALLGRLMDHAERDRLGGEAAARRAALPPETAAAAPTGFDAPSVRSARVDVLAALPPPDEEEQVLEDLDTQEIWTYLNPQMLYGKHLGLRGSFAALRAKGDPKALELETVVRTVLESGWIRIRAIYRFLGAESSGNDLHLFQKGRRVATLTFPRQRSGENLCLSDYVRPAEEGGGDSLALFVTTAGEGIRERTEALKQEGRYLLCHALQATALELAEAAAEWVHRRIREGWGIPDPPDTTMKDLFQARYRGKRYSFGYPA
jgi:5-methyltetrahydrofolate--homocysteine methyltransferase